MALSGRIPSLGSVTYSSQMSGSRHRPPSAYGGAGGFGTRISVPSYNTGLVFTGGADGSFQFSTSAKDLPFSGNEKSTMQNLNERLASYLSKVHSLEKANSKLELQIKEWYEKRAPVAGGDYSQYYQVIEELRTKIHDIRLDNAKTLLQIDNAKLICDDFRIKYEKELAIHHGVECDIQGMHRVLDELTMTKADLELQIEGLQEELMYLKKNHEEEVVELRKQLGGNVNVELDAAPGKDLGKLLADMRLQYEELTKKKRQEVKDWFDKQTEELNAQVMVSTAETKTSKNEITSARHTAQELEIQLQSDISKKAALENTLSETEARYGMQLAQIQTIITSLEAQLARLRTDAQSQSKEHMLLMDVKIRLEMEIATYRRLLDGEDNRSEALELEDALKEQSKSRKIKTIIEEVVDGKIVSSQVREVEEKM
ncbi:keratin, type I cytoskeletal 20 [Microcaecilia unicolor]|uniref:Keratin, type I cytoskeletal 20-like n=1 Tax=Microcaecilia unicolor TaxID=1415580 RepID=A0A6P7ZSW3_9AMPH|nr:keratin, type I cytoskeletal 20-like [Microcaecilia unicolor]